MQGFVGRVPPGLHRRRLTCEWSPGYYAGSIGARLEGLLQAALSRLIFKILKRMLLIGRCASLLLDSAHQEQVASMMPHSPEGAADNKLATASGIPGGPRPLPSVWAHLSGCTGPGCAGTWAREAVSAATTACFSVCLSIHLSTPLTDQGQGRDGQMQVLPLEKPSLKGEASSTRDFHPEKMQLKLGQACGQAKAQGGPLEGLQWRLRERWGLTQSHTAGLGQCRARCCGPQGWMRFLWPAPPLPPLCLALGCKHRENKFRFLGNIYLRPCGERAVGSVCWPPPVLPAGWPGAGGEGAWRP